MNYPGIGEHALTDIVEPERFSKEALQPVYQLNRALIELLVTSASRAPSEEQPQIVVGLRPTLSALESTAREQLARCPIALADLGFQNVEVWRQIEGGQTVLASLAACFPRLQAIQLAQTALTLAWTMSQSHREAAAIIFGLVPECAAILTKIGIQAIPRIAESYPYCVRPRWEADINFWRGLICTARVMDSPVQSRLPTVAMYAMQRQLSDLLFLSTHPATRETASTRTIQR